MSGTAGKGRLDETDFVFQAGNLKRTPRSGWLSIGITNCESVAEHSFRCALLAHIIARGEGLSGEQAKDAMMLALLHDIHESRIGDLHKLSKKYCKPDDQGAMDASIGPFSAEMELMKDKRLAEIVRDADLLEMFFQAKEYLDEGRQYAKEWLAPEKLRTKTARAIYGKMAARDSRAWLLGAIEW